MAIPTYLSNLICDGFICTIKSYTLVDGCNIFLHLWRFKTPIKASKKKGLTFKSVKTTYILSFGLHKVVIVFY